MGGAAARVCCRGWWWLLSGGRVRCRVVERRVADGRVSHSLHVIEGRHAQLQGSLVDE